MQDEDNTGYLKDIANIFFTIHNGLNFLTKNITESFYEKNLNLETY